MNLQRIIESNEEIDYLSRFKMITQVVAKDCIVDEIHHRVIFIVNSNDMKKVIEPKGATIKILRKEFNILIDVVQYSDNLKEFISNALTPARPLNIELLEELGRKGAVITVDNNEMGKAIGKRGRNIHKVRLVMRKYFDTDFVTVRSMNDL
jgi:N utilization substance protein A